MPLQNRVDPWGRLHAVPGQKSTLMGNRGGRFHLPDKTLGKRRWASRQWIACELEFRGRKREIWGDSYTELFFLDEVTALAAGHRPCFECRHKDAKKFLGDERAGDFDRRVHAERLAEPRTGNPARLPEGVMVEWDDAAHAIKGGRLLRWSFDGYDAVTTMPREARILTPPAIVAILAKGYKPRWHNSISHWETT